MQSRLGYFSGRSEVTIFFELTRSMHFLTFGSGQYVRYARELADSSRTLGGFESARVAGLEDLDPTFVSRNRKTLNTPRGGGL